MEGNFFIPAELLTKNEGNLEQIGKEIAHVLASNMPDDTKNKLFQNSLNRYHVQQDQLKKPFEGKITFSQAPEPLMEERLHLTSTPPPSFDLDSTFVTPQQSATPSSSFVANLTTIPPTKVATAKLLLEHINSIPNLKIDKQGRISYKDEVIEDSNITDLIADFTRNVQQSPVPGADVFAKALKETNVPLSYIGNRKRKELIRGGEAKLFKQAIDSLSPKWKNY